MGGQLVRPTGLIPAAYRELSMAMRTLIVAGVVMLGLLIAQVAVTPASESGPWVRVELTFATTLALILAMLSVRHTTGRIRAVRGWIAIATGFWYLGELIRNAELAAGVDAAPGFSDIPFAAVLVCAGLAYSAALRGRLRAGEELAVYLDGAIVFFATAALMVSIFGEGAARSLGGAIALAYAIFFLATTGATLLLDLALRVERRPHGAYVVLVGLVLLGAGFLGRLAVPPTSSIHEAAGPAHLLALGVLFVALGTITWTDVMDDDARYVRLTAALRKAMPIVAVGLTPLLMVAHFLRDLSGPVGIVNLVAIGLVLVTVAVRQSVLLSDREEAVRREVALGGELSVAKLRYQSLIERQPGVVYLAEPGPSGRWHFVSPQVEAMFGYAAEDWIADPELWARSVHPEDRESVYVADAAAADPTMPKRF